MIAQQWKHPQRPDHAYSIGFSSAQVEPCLTDWKIVEISHKHHDLASLLTSKSLLDQLSMFGIEAEPFELRQILARAFANLQL